MYHQQLSWSQRGQLWLRMCIRIVGVVLILLVLRRFGGPVLSLFMPFLLALAVAAGLDPVVRLLQKRLGWSRKSLSLLTLFLLFGGIGTVLALLVRAGVRELISLAENWDSLMDALHQVVQQTEVMLHGLLEKLPFELPVTDQPILDQLGQWLGQWLEGAMPELGNLTGFATHGAKEVTGFVLAVVVFLMAAFFLCADYPYLRTALTQRMDTRTMDWVAQVKRVSLAAFGGYLKAQLLLSAGVFFILLCGFLVTGQSYALLLALGFAALDFIPLIGAGTIMIPWAVIDLFLGRYEQAVSIVIIWGLLAVFRRLAEPKVVGDQTGLSPILSLISIYIGMRLYGVLGMILGPILLLVVLNLAGLGLFDRLRADLRMAFEDLLAILRGGNERKE